MMAVAWGVVGLMLAGVEGGCEMQGRAGEEREERTSEAPPPGAWQTVYLQPLAGEVGSRPGWRDVADHLYASNFRASFRYPKDTVQLRYALEGRPLGFSVVAPAWSLKPNFCYQMKLWGPLGPWNGDPQGRDFTNWALGSSGRWSDGAENMYVYASGLDMEWYVGKTMRGYLVFNFLVTEADGSVVKSSRVNNSFHVTWKTSQREPSEEDGEVRRFPVAVPGPSWVYDRAYPRVEAGVFGEWEWGRPRPRELELPAGTYSGVRFVLTEESFHSYLPEGGRWRTVMGVTLPDFVVP